MNMLSPYDEGDSYHYSIIDVTTGIIVREGNANTNRVDHQLEIGRYRVIIRSNNYELYEYPDVISLETDMASQEIDIELKELKSPMPELIKPDITHTIVSDGFTLQVIPNEYENVHLTIIDKVETGVDVSFFIAENQPNAGAAVRYNPVYNSDGKRADEILNEKAPDIVLPLLLNPESKDYDTFRNKLLESSEAEIFFNEKGKKVMVKLDSMKIAYLTHL
ncbi:outer membrane adhesin like protein, partial [Candidatus Magnetomorum sp. HK-1]